MMAKVYGCLDGFTNNGIKYQVCGEHTDTTRRLCGICRCGNRYSLEGQVMCDLYYGNGSDGACVISKNTTLPARTYNFESLTICPDVKVDFSGGTAVPIIKAQRFVCNLGTIDLRSCDCIYGCCCTFLLTGTIGNKATRCKITWTATGGAAASSYTGKGGNYGQNGASGRCSVVGGSSCCCNGGGGAGGPFCNNTQSSSKGCNATTTKGGNGGCGGGSGGYGCCCGGDGGNSWTNSSSSGHSEHNGGNGGNGCCYGGNGGLGCYGKGGDGGNSIRCKGGDGGVGRCGGAGGFSIRGTGGNGGNSQSETYTCGGKGGDTMYGAGGNGGCSCRAIGGNGGNATGGQYGIMFIAPCVVNTCIVGCGGTGGIGGKDRANCCSCGSNGYGGMGADIAIYYECSVTCGTICNKGGCGGNNTNNGADGTLRVCKLNLT